MASVGHVLVGAAAARLSERRLLGEGSSLGQSLALVFAFAALAMLPDLDVIAFALHIPYGDPFGHRGAAHSLAAALAIGLLAGVWAQVRKRPVIPFALVVFTVVASHGLLDTLTDGGRGVALLWPLSDERFFAPWRPIPVAPIGARMLSARGLYVVASELVLFSPALVIALWGAPGRVRAWAESRRAHIGK